MESGSESAGGSPAAGIGDLSTKYQKIATEFAKARAQVQVLKKAVKDEQRVKVELQEALRQLEQSSRKSEQEIDSLTFRNQQLTRRVTVLQDELEMQQYNKKKKNKSHDEHHNSEFTNHVIDEEFRKKIAENAELLSTMHEKEEAHCQEVVGLTEQVERLRRQLEQAQKSHFESEEKYKSTIAKLEREKVELREGREGLELAAEELSELQRTHTQYKTEMDSQITSAQTIIATHLPFVDSSNAELNSLNIPRFVERNRQAVPRSLMQHVCSELEEASGALAEFHRHSAQRLESLCHPQAMNHKFLSLLKESSQLASELRKGLSDVGPSFGDDKLDTKTAFQKIPNLLASYCTHLETFMPFLRTALEYEETHLSDESSKACNDQVALVTSQFVSHCVQLNSLVTLISKQKTLQQSYQGWQMRHEQELVDIFNSIHEDSKDLLSSYVLKFDKESSKNRNENLSLTNTYITSALSRFMDSTGKMLKNL
ncbi:protein phosphatase 1 regulatory subunit 21 [Nilaparvata lugens]|uniref:protein phosphatase 1 regulatory subunit 21 n=1 Tax=Nilaparvata lugens TaxID=108931 RepID=UPI00193DC7DE|nr:protein phosphatase 1 regulatory subunit 21 [Nilaparvata lugens]